LALTVVLAFAFQPLPWRNVVGLPDHGRARALRSGAAPAPQFASRGSSVLNAGNGALLVNMPSPTAFLAFAASACTGAFCGSRAWRRRAWLAGFAR